MEKIKPELNSTWTERKGPKFQSRPWLVLIYLKITNLGGFRGSASTDSFCLPWCQCYKTFFSLSPTFHMIKPKCISLSTTFKPNLIFQYKAGIFALWSTLMRPILYFMCEFQPSLGKSSARPFRQLATDLPWWSDSLSTILSFN